MTSVYKVACCIAAVFALVAAGSPLLQSVHGTWALQRNDYQNRWQLRLSSDGDEQTLRMDAPPTSGTFSIRREAGTFDFTGTLSDDGGSGQFTFTPSAAFVNGLGSRHLHPESIRDIMAAASVDLTLEYIDSIAAAGYPNLGFDKTIAFRAVGATPGSIAELRSVFGTLSSEDVVSTSALHVTRAYVDELHTMGVYHVTPERAVTFKALDIDKAYIAELARMGYSHMDPQDVVSFKAMHIDAAYLQHLRAHGLKNLTAQQVIEMKATGL